jgi:hypothetical protein
MNVIDYCYCYCNSNSNSNSNRLQKHTAYVFETDKIAVHEPLLTGTHVSGGYKACTTDCTACVVMYCGTAGYCAAVHLSAHHAAHCDVDVCHTPGPVCPAALCTHTLVSHNTAAATPYVSSDWPVMHCMRLEPIQCCTAPSFASIVSDSSHTSKQVRKRTHVSSPAVQPVSSTACMQYSVVSRRGLQLAVDCCCCCCCCLLHRAVLPVELLHGITFACGWGAGTINSKRVAPPELATTMQVRGAWYLYISQMTRGCAGVYNITSGTGLVHFDAVHLPPQAALRFTLLCLHAWLTLDVACCAPPACSAVTRGDACICSCCCFCCCFCCCCRAFSKVYILV